MNDHYRDQVTDLCDWLRDEETARFLSGLDASIVQKLLAGKADQIDPAIQLETPRQSKSTRPRPESGG
jgi:hypothetical protein